MIPSKWLKAEDCTDGDLTLTIRSVIEEPIGQGADRSAKWVCYFHEHHKGLVLNKTNINTIAKLLGEDTDQWIGNNITLYACEVQFQDKMVDAIRVRSRSPRPPTAPAGVGAGWGPPLPPPTPAAPSAPAAPVAARADHDDDDDIPF